MPLLYCHIIMVSLPCHIISVTLSLIGWLAISPLSSPVCHTLADSWPLRCYYYWYVIAAITPYYIITHCHFYVFFADLGYCRFSAVTLTPHFQLLLLCYAITPFPQPLLIHIDYACRHTYFAIRLISFSITIFRRSRWYYCHAMLIRHAITLDAIAITHSRYSYWLRHCWPFSLLIHAAIIFIDCRYWLIFTLMPLLPSIALLVAGYFQLCIARYWY